MASVASEAVRTTYNEKFDARMYADLFSQKTGKVATFVQHELHSIFQSDLVQGKTLVDVGTGPNVIPSLLASSRCNDIVLSDLVEGNRLELNKWLNKDEDAVDWTVRAEQVAALEGYSDVKKGALEILERTRFAVRKVVPCDVLEPGVLPEEHRETFDVVFSAGCLESAAADHESFRRVVCNVATLAKPGGLLVLVGMGGSKGYPVGTVEFPQANVTEDVIKGAVTDAGLQMKVFHTKSLKTLLGKPDVFTFVLAARKP